MKFLIFTKQVPDVAEIRFDPERRTIVREGVKNIVNAYDRRAISEAIRYRNENGGEVTVATMGPPQARDALLEALLMGADRAIHIQDNRLAGSDTLITARVLAAAARKIGFDVIFCGQHSTDSETGQVPPELAEILGIPVATSVFRLEYLDGRVRATCETDEGSTIWELPLPAVLSAAERLIKPIKTKDADISVVPPNKVETWDLDTLGIAGEAVGTDASPTWVANIFEESITRNPRVEQGLDAVTAAKAIIAMIQQQSEKSDLPVVPATSPTSKAEYWCMVEWLDHSIRPASLEILANAAELASKCGAIVSAVSLREVKRPEDIAILSSYGADSLYEVSREDWHPDLILALLCERIDTIKPQALFLPATSAGKYLAPRIAARLQLGLTGDCVGFKIDPVGKLVQLKPAFGGNILASIYSRTFPQFATVRPGALTDFAPRSSKQIPIVLWEPPVTQETFRIVESQIDEGRRAVKMETSEVVICVGMGLGQENVPLAFRLAELLDAGIGATRRVVDNRWMGRQFQVGLTGKFISPRVYLGLGVSGRFNHTIGIRKSNKIVAINNDPNAEIWSIADLGIVGDCVEIVKKMIEVQEELNGAVRS
jgi:electron transfer flavoprotein alpha subunit